MAGDIVPPAGVTAHNPGMAIATLNDKGKWSSSPSSVSRLASRRGANRPSGAEIGRIPVDSIYSPVPK